MSGWSSDVCSSDLNLPAVGLGRAIDAATHFASGQATRETLMQAVALYAAATLATELPRLGKRWWLMTANARIRANLRADALRGVLAWPMAKLTATLVGDTMARVIGDRSEEHTSELQSLMRISYAVFC